MLGFAKRQFDENEKHWKINDEASSSSVSWEEGDDSVIFMIHFDDFERLFAVSCRMQRSFIISLKDSRIYFETKIIKKGVVNMAWLCQKEEANKYVNDAKPHYAIAYLVNKQHVFTITPSLDGLHWLLSTQLKQCILIVIVEYPQFVYAKQLRTTFNPVSNVDAYKIISRLN